MKRKVYNKPVIDVARFDVNEKVLVEFPTSPGDIVEEGYSLVETETVDDIFGDW